MMIQDIADIKQLVLKMNSERKAPSRPQIMSSVELNVTNTALELNPSYYYDITLKLKLGSLPVTFTTAYVQLSTEQTPEPSPMYLDSANVQWKIKGIKCNRVFIDPNSILDAHVVVGYIGYDNPQHIHLSI